MSKEKLRKELEAYIHDSEEIIDTLFANYETKYGILGATATRLIFLSKGFLSGRNVVEIPYSNIKSFEYQTKRSEGKLEVYGAGEEKEFDRIYYSNLDHLPDFVQTLRQQHAALNSEPKEQPSDNDDADKYSQLEKIAKLKESGVLTEEEFEEEKRKILEG